MAEKEWKPPTMEELFGMEPKKKKTQVEQPKKDITPLVNRLKTIRNQLDEVIEEMDNM